MKYAIGLFAMMMATAGCGGGSGGDAASQISISATAIEVQGTWSAVNTVRESAQFEVSHAAGLRAYVSSPHEYAGKMSVSTTNVSATLTRFSADVEIDKFDVGNYTIPLNVTLEDSTKNVVASKSLNLTVRVKDSLKFSVYPADAPLYGAYNRDQTDLAKQLFIRSNKLQYTISDSENLLNFTKTSEQGTSSIQATIKPSADKAGVLTTNITVATLDKAFTASVPVTVDIDRPRWSFERQGFLFSKLADSELLSSSMRITTTSNMPRNTFSVSSDSAWLQANVVDDQLTASVNPAGLATGLHFAELTVKSATVAEQPEQKLAVYFYINSSISSAPTHAIGTFEYVSSSYIGPYLLVGRYNEAKLGLFNIFTGKVEEEVLFYLDKLIMNPFRRAISNDGRYVNFLRLENDRYYVVQYDLRNKKFIKSEKPMAESFKYENSPSQLNEIDIVPTLGYWGNQVSAESGRQLQVRASQMAVNFEQNYVKFLSNDILLNTKYTNDGGVSSYYFNVFQFNVAKNANTMFVTKLVGSKLVNDIENIDVIGNNMVYIDNNSFSLPRVFSVEESGELTVKTLPVVNKAKPIVCKIDNQSFYRFSKATWNSTDILMERITKDGAVLASKKVYVNPDGELKWCQVMHNNQRVILSLDRGPRYSVAAL